MPGMHLTIAQLARGPVVLTTGGLELVNPSTAAGSDVRFPENSLPVFTFGSCGVTHVFIFPGCNLSLFVGETSSPPPLLSPSPSLPRPSPPALPRGEVISCGFRGAAPTKYSEYVTVGAGPLAAAGDTS